MPFSNPVVGGIFLIRPAIRSPNYVAGVSGWTINRDGSAEFANGTFRGPVVVIGADGSEIEIIAGGGTAKILYVPPPDPAHVVSYDPGQVNMTGGGLTPALFLDSPKITGQNAAEIVLLGQNGGTPARIAIGGGTEQVIFGSGETVIIQSGCAFTIDGVSQGRGLITRVEADSSSGAIGAETVLLTLPSATYKNGRVYEFTFAMTVIQSAIGDVIVRLRKGTTTAGTLFAFFRYPMRAASTDYTWNGVVQIRNSSGADVTTQFVLTLNASAGTVATDAGTAQLAWLQSFDVAAFDSTNYGKAAGL